VLFDTENQWALDNAEGFSRNTKKYAHTVHAHYKVFWDANVPVDVITPDKCADLSRYKIVAAPMQYMMGEKMMDEWQTYVKNGGTLVSTYISGMVNENDLVYLGGFPQPLRELFGIAVTETDTLYPSQKNGILYNGESYEAVDYCAVFDLCGAEALGTYASDFYAGGAAITRNAYGKGAAYFIGARTGADFLEKLYLDALVKPLDIIRPPIEAPTGVSVQTRVGEGKAYHFVMNYTEERQIIDLPYDMRDLITGETIKKGRQTLPVYGVLIVTKV
jgi:beta-galactosidase